MNVSEQAVTNAANLAFLMVNLSAVLLLPLRCHQPDFSILDLKAHYRARRYLDETKMNHTRSNLRGICCKCTVPRQAARN
jgi:hypothetical protein